MTIDTQKLREFIRRAVPLPWTLATSNSWRRILSRDGAAVCSPCNQPDGHPDLHFPGDAEGPTAQLLIEAANALPALLDHIEAQRAEIDRYRRAAGRWKKVAESAEERVRDQAAEIARTREALTELCDEIDKHEIHAAISKTSISWFKRKARATLAQEQKQKQKQGGSNGNQD